MYIITITIYIFCLQIIDKVLRLNKIGVCLKNVTIMQNRKKAEQEALQLLSKLGYLEPPVNIMEVARVIGLSLAEAEFSAANNHISGLLDYRNNKIIVNKEEPGNRQNFTIAHEIGHFVLHKDWITSNDYQPMFRQKESFNKKNEKEVEADIFAAHLLVPKYMLDKYYGKAVISELSVLFCVSELVIQNRINDL